MFICCDCKIEIPESESDKTMPNADGSATIQCIPCYVASPNANPIIVSMFDEDKNAELLELDAEDEYP